MSIESYPSPNGVLTSLIWRKTAAGAETSLSGYDNASQALSYTPGQEQVYLNGILLVRGDDYTATNGTSITGLSALAENDFIQINCYNNFSVASVPTTSLTGTVSNAQLANSAITINGSAVSLGGSVSLPGDIESVTAGTGLTGGGTSGSVTLALDSSSVISPTIVNAKGDILTASADNVPAILTAGNSGETLVADSSTSTGLRYQAAKVVNAIYNSSFDIWQRGTTAAISASGNYIADRWRYYRPTTGSTGSRSTDVPTGFTYSAKTQRDSGNTSVSDIYIGQALENVDSVRFVGQTVTLSYWAKAGANFSGASSQFTAQIQTGSGTNQAIYDFTVLQNIGSNQTITTTWTKYTVTGTVSGSATQIGVRFFYTPVGTAGADDSFLVTGVQLEVGSTPTIYSKLGGSIQGELAACQRYYYRVTPSVTNGAFSVGNNYSSTINTSVIYPKVTLRTTPTLETSGTASHYRVNTAGTGFTCSAVPVIDQTGTDIIAINATVSSGLTVGNAGILIALNGVTSILAFSAEL
jgi:hypothetical protein